jgi:hypothetical protein
MGQDGVVEDDEPTVQDDLDSLMRVSPGCPETWFYQEHPESLMNWFEEFVASAAARRER